MEPSTLTEDGLRRGSGEDEYSVKELVAGLRCQSASSRFCLTRFVRAQPRHIEFGEMPSALGAVGKTVFSHAVSAFPGVANIFSLQNWLSRASGSVSDISLLWQAVVF
jgi:hypothetical protein